MEINNIKKESFMGGIFSPDMMNGGSGCIISSVVCNRTATADVGGDFNIPEHMPEMRKLIKVDVRPSAPSDFISGSGIQVNGGIEYRALYLGTDGEIYCAPFLGEYSLSVPFNDGVSAADMDKVSVTSTVYPESAVSRVGGSRRLSIRSRLSARVLALDEKKKDGYLSAPCDGHIQRLIKKKRYCTERHGVKDDTELVCSVDTSENGVRYICSDCRVFIEDAICGDGYADCRGFVSVKHIMSRDGKPYILTDKLQLSETIEADGLAAGSSVCVSGVCTEISVAAPVADDMSDKITVVMRLRLEASGFSCGEMEYVKDAYSTEFDCDLKTESSVLPSLLACKNGNMTFSASTELSEMGLSDGMSDIIDVSGSAAAEAAEFDGDKWTVSGKCRFNVIYGGEENGDVSSFETELPFKYEFDGEAGESDRFECSVTAMDVRARNDGERMTFDCELALSCYILGKDEAEIITDIVIGDRNDRGSRGFTVCYPDKSDSLWSVAKRYRAPIAETAKENGINGGADADNIGISDGTKYMIV